VRRKEIDIEAAELVRMI